MILSEELQRIEVGEQGAKMKRILDTLITYGEAFDAQRMVKLTGKMGHVVFGSAPVTWIPVFDLLDELVADGLQSSVKFTADPRAFDAHVPMTIPQKLMFNYIFAPQKRLDAQYEKLGLVDDNAYTCTCYMPEVGNVPEKGDILSWAESSAVVYANSVLGARCNRNSGVIEHMGQILGYVPEFGLLTDEGRRADLVVEIRTAKKPEAQILGSAIGMKAIEKVPYIKGLDKWLGTTLDEDACGFLKDMGAASASNGAVGLYHVENLTPEAAEQGEALIREGAEFYVIDDAELQRVKDSYPCIWEDPNKAPQLCFIGCPHLSLKQIIDWTDRIGNLLELKGRKKVSMPTVLLTAPAVADAFKEKYPRKYSKLRGTKAVLSSICPLSYTGNPLCKSTRIITCSNKLRYYSQARFYSEDELTDIITGGEKAI